MIDKRTRHLPILKIPRKAQTKEVELPLTDEDVEAGVTEKILVIPGDDPLGAYIRQKPEGISDGGRLGREAVGICFKHISQELGTEVSFAMLTKAAALREGDKGGPTYWPPEE